MPALDLALRLRMVRRPARVGEAFFGKPVGKLLRHVRWPVVREDTGPVPDLNLAQPRGLQSEVQGFLRIDGGHVSAELPTDDVTREII